MAAKPLNLTLSPGEEQQLRAFAKRLKLAPSEALGQVIESLGEQSPKPAKKSKAKSSAYNGQLGVLLARIEDANHAFYGKRWVRAIESYQDLLKDISDNGGNAEMADLRRWATYRLAFMWIDVSYDLRRRGLTAVSNRRSQYPSPVVLGAMDWNHAYDVACRALEHSANLGKYSSVVGTFNAACAKSLRAQFEIERAFLKGDLVSPQSAFYRQQRDKLIQNYDQIGVGGSVASNLYNRISGPQKDNPRITEARNFARQAMDCLLAVFSTSVENAESPDQSCSPTKDHSVVEISNEAGTLSWLIESAWRDVDLNFLRAAKGFDEEFATWLDQLVAGENSVIEWCESQLDAHDQREQPIVGSSQTNRRARRIK